ncbi:protein C10 isoform X2 [Rhipicephalus microplus]|uniref:protein C10 isoform X2 n=1 Tax=Rhipicephalus microplus TaxID=6941 RepID=UPI003F6D8AB0
MSTTLALKENFDSEKAKGALEDILAAFDQPENFVRLQDAKDLAGNDMLKHMQIVFPLLTQIEMTVIESYGFTRDGEVLHRKSAPKLAKHTFIIYPSLSRSRLDARRPASNI